MVNMGEVAVLSSLSCSGLTTGKKISPFRTSNPRRKQTTGTKKGFPMTISVTPPPGTTPGVTTIFFLYPYSHLFSQFLRIIMDAGSTSELFQEHDVEVLNVFQDR